MLLNKFTITKKKVYFCSKCVDKQKGKAYTFVLDEGLIQKSLAFFGPQRCGNNGS